MTIKPIEVDRQTNLVLKAPIGAVSGAALAPLLSCKFVQFAVSDVKAFRKVQDLGYPLGKGAVICAATQAMPLTEAVSIVPVGAL